MALLGAHRFVVVVIGIRDAIALASNLGFMQVAVVPAPTIKATFTPLATASPS